MASNVYTKNEILKTLASRGYFIDAYTLDTFFKKWRVEAIFEDEQGSEFYDKNALDLVLSNLFNNQEQEKEDSKEPPKTQQAQPKEEQPASKEQTEPTKEQPPQKTAPPQPSAADEKPKIEIDDEDTASILNNISLSDGTSLIDKIQETTSANVFDEKNLTEIKPIQNEFETSSSAETNPPAGILDGAMALGDSDYYKDIKPQDITPAPSIDIDSIGDLGDTGDLDDMTLLSESLEAQEKFKEYVISELSRKNSDFAVPKPGEFKLDISERTLSMIARSMAKKIAKYVNSICTQDAKSAAKLADMQEENKKLEQRARELEEQNRKLRLLLAESNKNLNSYKPSIFGLYKKENPGK